jgi:lysozyme
MSFLQTNRRKAGAIAMAAAIAAPCEGLRQWAYYCPAGVLTVCEGHTGPDVMRGRKYSLAECDAFMSADMKKAIDVVERCVPGLPQEVLAAFGDAVFNLGGTIACNREASTAARYLYKGQLLAACNELPKWNRARVAGVLVPLPGLTKRRAIEQDVCLRGLA